MVHAKLMIAILAVFRLGFSPVEAQICQGRILDAESGKPMAGANVLLIGSLTGTVSDSSGYFELDYSTQPEATVKVSYLGYRSIKVTGCPDGDAGEIRLQADAVLLGGAVISASRFEEAQFTSAVTIHRLNRTVLRTPVAGDYYQELNALPGISVVENSMAFRVINTRGFNTTSPFRMVQWVDGVDNLTPVLNFSPGGFLGPVPLDLEEIEVLSGPASALYGPNAMQGMVVATTRLPFGDEGISFDLQGGTRDFGQAQVRWAQVFGPSNAFAAKVALSYTRAQEWIATDSIQNRYRARNSAPQNLDVLAEQLPGSGSLSSEELALVTLFQDYAQMYPTAQPGTVSYGIPGYAEKDLLTESLAQSLKLNTGLFYESKMGWHAEYLMRYSRSTGVYQGNNRAYLKNFSLLQHKIGFNYRNFQVKLYANTDQVGDSYDLVLTGISIAQQQVPTATRDFLLEYMQAMEALSNGFSEAPDEADRIVALSAGAQAASLAFALPGTVEFENLLSITTQSTDRPVGSRYISRSSIYHGEVQYTLPLTFLKIMTGASIRRYQPRTEGRLFADTLMQNGEFRNIGFYEYGGFVQASRDVAQKWTIQGSLRLDKSQNYDLQFSPRLAIGFNPKPEHHLRLSAQSAFRTPSLNDQYFLLNVGAFIVRGNAEGYDNLYSTASVSSFLAGGGVDTSLLVALVLPRVRPESLNMVELGYRVDLPLTWQMELAGYGGFYQDFIGSIRAVEPRAGTAGANSGVADILNSNYQSYNIAANSASRITTYGGTLSIGGTILPGWFAQTHYTYAGFTLTEKDDGLIPGFNTPPHRIVFSSAYQFPSGDWSLKARWYWQDTFVWESPFADGQVPVNHGLDVRVGYTIANWNSTLSLGGNNLYNNKRIQAAGGPEIGSFYYVSWRFEWARQESGSK